MASQAANRTWNAPWQMGGALARAVLRNACRAAAVCGIALCSIAAASAAEWTIVDLGTLGGAYSNARSINDHGQAAGSAYAADDGTYHAFLFDGRNMTDLGTLGGTNSVALGINNGGDVAGSSYVRGDEAEHAFLYSHGGSMTDLGTLGGKNSAARAVNNHGEVAGYSELATGGHHAFLYSHGKMRDLGTLDGDPSAARAVNDSGWVAGDADIHGGHAYHAFLYRQGQPGLGALQDLGTLGGTNSSARAINGHGWVAGDADTAGDATHHAFLYRNGRMKDLGSLGGQNSFAYGINNRGQIVGYSDTTPTVTHFPRVGQARRAHLDVGTDGSAPLRAHLGDLFAFDHHAFLYDERRGMLDLSKLPEVKAAGWTSLNYAYAINERGEIAGNGTINGTSHAFLLSPAQKAGNLPASQ